MANHEKFNVTKSTENLQMYPIKNTKQKNEHQRYRDSEKEVNLNLDEAG